MRAAVAIAIGLFATEALAQTPVLKREPAMGTLTQGEIVLVDDGKCPKGQIRRVVGGNHVDVGGTKRIRRTSTCVRR